MVSIRGKFKQLPKQIQFILIVVFVMVGMWMFITPFYDMVKDFFDLTPWVSVIIGALIVFFGIRKWRLHPW